MKEEVFYNALNILFEANYQKLLKAKTKYLSWGQAWVKVGSNSINPEKEWEKLKKLNIRLLLQGDADYPSLLKEIAGPPLGIYVLGASFPKKEPTLAIVGTRKATAQGKEIAQEFSFKLASAGIKIVSGLALGIDASAHEGTLRAGSQTIAVLGNGLDNFYPRQNESLAKKILKNNGALISEYPLSYPSLPHNFLDRNRIVSGLSRGVLVVEAPKISGALSTAAFAVNQNREVFVIPGPINNPNYEGSNNLIKEGARLVTAPEEILEDFNIQVSATAIGSKNLTSEERLILAILSKSGAPLFADKIIEETNLAASEVNRILSLLVIKKIISENQNQYYLK